MDLRTGPVRVEMDQGKGMMDGYQGSNDILERLEYACQGPPAVDLYWGDAMDLLREARDEIRRLRAGSPGYGWEANPDRSGGMFTQHEIDEARRHGR